MVRLILFDIDGTLVRTGGAGVKAFGKVFETEFGATEGFEQLKFAGRTDVSLVREFFTMHGIPPSTANFRRFFDRYVFWLAHIIRECPASVCPGIRNFLTKLRCASPQPLTGLLTGNIRSGAEIKLRHLGLWDEFATGGFADDHEQRDQIAAIAKQRGMEMLAENLSPEQVLVVGDTPLDIKCGRAIGARVLSVATGGSTLDELREHQPDWVMQDLTGADPSTFLL